MAQHRSRGSRGDQVRVGRDDGVAQRRDPEHGDVLVRVEVHDGRRVAPARVLHDESVHPRHHVSVGHDDARRDDEARPLDQTAAADADDLDDRPFGCLDDGRVDGCTGRDRRGLGLLREEDVREPVRSDQRAEAGDDVGRRGERGVQRLDDRRRLDLRADPVGRDAGQSGREQPDEDEHHGRLEGGAQGPGDAAQVQPVARAVQPARDRATQRRAERGEREGSDDGDRELPDRLADLLHRVRHESDAEQEPADEPGRGKNDLSETETVPVHSAEQQRDDDEHGDEVHVLFHRVVDDAARPERPAPPEVRARYGVGHAQPRASEGRHGGLRTGPRSPR
ncbi:hypothetical protein GALL_366650 [mine drainage metagenome]|uniref:Uncharacterized protein n=1 Tax=mine drainage metagenome TaxID=410659 RepID=A0A1J5QNN6_9ZZZZ